MCSGCGRETKGLGYGIDSGRFPGPPLGPPPGIYRTSCSKYGLSSNRIALITLDCGPGPPPGNPPIGAPPLSLTNFDKDDAPGQLTSWSPRPTTGLPPPGPPPPLAELPPVAPPR